MKTSTIYRGVRINRLNLSSISQGCYGGEWTELWLVGGNGDAPMTWNAACAWVDEVSGLSDECGYEGPPFYCGDCGERELLHWDDSFRNQLLAHRMCFSCNHLRKWSEAHSANPDSMFVAGGERFTIAPDGERSLGTLGYGGARFVIERPDGQRIVTHNLWRQGEVPPGWRDRLPDTARFVRDEAAK